MIYRRLFFCTISFIVWIHPMYKADAFDLASTPNVESQQKSEGVFQKLKEELEKFEEQIRSEEVDPSALLSKLGKVERYRLVPVPLQSATLKERCGTQGMDLFKIDTITGDVWKLSRPDTDEERGLGWRPIQTFDSLDGSGIESSN